MSGLPLSGDAGTAVPLIWKEKSMNSWEYLGDGVYVNFDGFGIWLHANSHDKPTDRIYLEPQILQSLNEYAERMRKVITP